MLTSIASRPTLLAALILAAAPAHCPYTAPAPIADASTKALDPRLAGKWHCAGADNDDPITITASPISATEFLMIARGDSTDTLALRFHSAKSGSDGLVNVEELKPGKPSEWSLGRLTLLRPTVLYLEIADEAPFKADSTAPPKDVIKRSIKRGNLFYDWFVCIRDGGK